jgi:hypothetical protein
VFAVPFTALVSLGMADEPKKSDKEVKGKEVKKDSKGTPYKSAAAIDFAQELGLPFNTLTALGARIEQARQDGDPVGLAAAAAELSAAEKVSGKKAGLTAADLEKEAVTMARERGRSKELQAVALLLPDASADLKDAAEKAAKREQQEAAAARSGEKKRGVQGELTVYNDSSQSANVFYNGQHLGWVEPGRRRQFTIGDYSGDSSFHVRATGDHGTQWDWDDHGDFDTYWWRIWEQ